MNYLGELLSEARRRAKISGKPLSPQELTGISESASQGAGDRALATKKLADERENQLRMKKSAKDALKIQEQNQKVDMAGNAYTIDKAMGSPVQGAVTDAVKWGANKAIDVAGARPMVDSASRAMGNLTNNLIGNTAAGAALPAAQTVIPGVTQGALMTQATNPAVANMMGQIGGQAAMSAGAGAGAGATGSTLGSILSSIASPVSFIAAAAAVRNIWGGDLKRDFKDAGWSQKIARAPVSQIGLPGFGATESMVLDKVLGKNNPLSKVTRSVSNTLGKLEEKVVGQPLDKIFKAVGSIFCFAKGTPIQMEDGTLRNAEDVKLKEKTLEGGMVTGWGVVLNEDIWDYKGVKLAGTHAVLENGKWVRISQSKYGKPLEIAEPVEVYPIVNENHVVIVNDIVFSDYAETDHGTHVNDAFRLEYMNTQDEWNQYLTEKYRC